MKGTGRTGRRALGATALLAAMAAGVGASPAAAAPAPAGPAPALEVRPRATEPARPTEVPVLLVPGWSDTERDLAALRILLTAAGWTEESVMAVSFDDPFGSNRDHAEELARAARVLLERTGAERLDVVAHSMGGLATRVWLRNGGAAVVRRVVFAASPHHGTWSAWLAWWGEGGEEMRPGSPFLAWLAEEPGLPEGVEGLTVRTLLETHVLPPESALLPGVPDVEVCCPTHMALLRDLEAFRIIRRFLEDGALP